MTLQNLCLKVIISEFKWYCEVYCCTENPCLKLKFAFLKKKYSLLILEKLRDEHRLEAKYLEFLINKYLKVLDTRWLSTWPWEAICQRFAEIGANLKEVTFFRYDMPWEEVLCYLPNLTSVSFKYFCADKFLLALSKFCKCVETLDIHGSKKVSDNGLKHLCCKDDDENVHSLHAPIKELLVVFTNVTDEGIAYTLKNMPFLEKIDYRKLPEVLYSMHESDINAFDRLKPYNLTHLDLLRVSHNIPEFTNIFTVCAFVCPHLRSLSCPILQKCHLDFCSQLQELEELVLDHYYAEDQLELNELLTLIGKKLTSLKIRNFCMSLSIFAQNCPNLITLVMSNVILQYNFNDCVPTFDNLEIVFMSEFTEAGITKALACLLISAPNLKQLYFRYCELRSSDIKIYILRCCEQFELNVVDFRISGIELDLVRDVLLTCSTLQTLYLYDNFNYDATHELQTLSTSLPNKPQICFDSPYICNDDFAVYSQDVSSDEEEEDDEKEEDDDDEEEDVYG